MRYQPTRLTGAQWRDRDDRIADVLKAHQLGEASGGYAWEAYVDCSCGEHIAIRGGLREQAAAKALRHVSHEIGLALNAEVWPIPKPKKG